MNARPFAGHGGGYPECRRRKGCNILPQHHLLGIYGEAQGVTKEELLFRNSAAEPDAYQARKGG